MYLEGLSPKEMEAAARLRNDEDFKLLIEYMAKQTTLLAVKSTNLSGDQGEKCKGASLIMSELRDTLAGASEALQVMREHEEMKALDRDPISP